MAEHPLSLSAVDRQALVESFQPLEAVHPDLPDRLLRSVTEGDDEDVLASLQTMPGTIKPLGLEFCVQGLPHPHPQTTPPAWEVLIDHADQVPVNVLLRLVKVMAAAASSASQLQVASGLPLNPNALSMLKPVSAPAWLEVLLKVGVRLGPSYSGWPHYGSRIPAELVESLLAADGQATDLIYRKAFPKKRWDLESMQVMHYFAGLPGYGKCLGLQRHVVAEALTDASAPARVLALGTFQTLGIPPTPFVELIARLAVEPAKSVREAASGLMLPEGAAALPPLRQIAETGKPDEKAHALRLIARLDLPEGKAFLHQRVADETTPAVLKVLQELASADGTATTPAPQPSVDLDIFAGVALSEETRAAISAWAKRVAATDLDEAFAWLTQPTPWTGDPRPILAQAASDDVEGLKGLLERPELKPVHAVRLLRLGRLLQTSHEPHLKDQLDYRIPRETLTRLLATYRDTHQPRMGLRELADAFRASALDEDLIAHARFSHWHRQFEWEDQATWPYFADRLDWLAKALDPPSSTPDWTTRYLGTTDLRSDALAVLATFPEPPPRFLPRLWELALGTSKVHRPLAQQALEKLPDCPKRLFETLASRDSQTRKAAAEWIARLKPEGAADALCSALEAEKSTPVKAVLAGALEALGGAKSRNKPEVGDTKDSRDSLRGEAAIGLKKGIPEKCAWFPFDRLPEVRWVDDDMPVEREVLNWLVVSAWKTKSAEPTALLREKVKLVREDDARRLGSFVLEAWLAEDLRPPTPADLLKRLEFLLQSTGAATIDEIVQKRPELAPAVEFEKNRPMSVRAEDKGILALAAACGPTDVVDRIRSYVNQWYGYRAAQCRALIQVLAWIDHPEAVAFLLDIARRFRTATIRQEAESQVRKLAERKETTLAELADQALPDAGFDAEGKLVLDFGPGKFLAWLDDDAELFLEDPSGNEIKALPAPTKTDNAELAAAAKKRLTEVKKELKAVRKRVVERLYEAMCTQRAWTFADWQRSLLRHPVAGRLCCRVIWTFKEGSGPASTFRPLEDGTLTDLDDNEIRRAADATVRIAHRLTLAYKTAARWVVHMDDFEVDPLLPQFARSVFRLPKESQSATEWPLRLDQPQAVQPLTRRARGLGYDPVAFRLQDGGDHFIKHFPAASLRAEIKIADFDNKEQATRLELTFRPGDAPRDSGIKSRAVPLGQVPPVLLSECHADLMALVGSVAGQESDEDEDADEG